jgi:hypothetical protein
MIRKPDTFVDRLEAQQRVCTDLFLAWEVAFHRYAVAQGVPASAHVGLSLKPHISPLPERVVIEALYGGLDAWGLMLVTARHERGYIVEKVKSWRERPLQLEGGTLMPENVGEYLDAWDRRLTEGEGDEMLALCFSDDALEGKGDPGDYCPSCLKAEWQTNEETGKRLPPACVRNAGDTRQCRREQAEQAWHHD